MTSSIYFNKTTTIKAKLERVFEWHERPGALERLTPPWIKMKVISAQPGINSGSNKIFKMKIGPFWSTWHIVHEEFVKYQQFCDTQISGPFHYWYHKHKFKTSGDDQTIIEDRIHYQLPLASLTQRLLKPYVQGKLKRTFAYRHEILKKDLQFEEHYGRTKPLRILIAGGSGFIGKHLRYFLQTQGHHVVTLSRKESLNSLYWNPEKAYLRPKVLEGFDAIVNLSGAPLLRPWTQKSKKDIYNSRIKSTALLINKLGKVKKKPAVLINASGINAYGFSREEKLHEQSALRDEGFLSKVCRDWESSALEAEKLGIRVVNIRMGMVLSSGEGALSMMLTTFKACIGGRFGNGLQFTSWISIDDLIDSIYYCILNNQIRGVVNGTAPHPISNFNFKQALSRHLKRPAWLPVPSWLITLFFGELGKEVILSNLKVHPQKLLASGFKFRYPTLESALKHLVE